MGENRRFVGWGATLEALRGMLLLQEECQKVALVWLGGIGKTQVALCSLRTGRRSTGQSSPSSGCWKLRTGLCEDGEEA